MEKLKILAIGFVYNEIEFIPIKHKWSRDQDIDLYIIDNMSNDGTWEYLQNNKIKSHRVDTNNTFDLRILQSEVIKVLHKIKPDWVIYHGADLFFFTKEGLRNDIEKANSEGYDGLSLTHIEMMNTGEKRNEGENIFEVFNFGLIQSKLNMVMKYKPDLKIMGDNMNSVKPKEIEYGLLVNYGMTKSKKERIDTLDRRKKAWKNGLKEGYGKHYVSADKNNWEWDKKVCKEIKNTKYSFFLDKIINYGKK